ncbi:MAG TPA: 1,4-alpha-glucan branching protein GlgB [Iamia sp.]|nr:1,4-alpha-glucan branching protein GlgB [Iamia sp.]
MSAPTEIPPLGDVDVHLFNEGRHRRLHEILGALTGTVDGEAGTMFRVWAPDARGVSVVGDFSHWDGSTHPMKPVGSSGIWELFVPGVGAGARYKLEVHGHDGSVVQHADPLARQAEVPPASASVVTESHHAWGDAGWLERRRTLDPQAGPMSIYEVHLGSWRRDPAQPDVPLGYAQVADELAAYVTDMGFTHVELLPVMHHPYSGSWGYQVTSFFAPEAAWGTPDELKYLVDTLHAHGIGVILDWVPAHFPRDEWALARFDGTELYEHAGARGSHPDWGTLVFNHGRHEVKGFLLANALYWLQEMHADGLRVDAVASMLYLDYSREAGQWSPNVHGGREDLEAVAFLQEANTVIHEEEPGVISAAEESTAWPGVSRPVDGGGLGFGFKWNMGWMHDTLAYFAHDPVHRKHHHGELTFSLVYAFDESFILPLSHDEVVHGKRSLLEKMPGDRWQQMANLRALYAYMWAHPGKQLLFMGGEIAQEREWSEARSLDWHLLERADHAGVQALVRDLNHCYRRHPALWEVDGDPRGFAWIEGGDADRSVVAFARRSADDGQQVVCMANLTPVVREGYRVGLPGPGRWTEVLNTDAAAYGGSNVGNLGGVDAEPRPWHGQQWSAELTLPPLGVVWFTSP